LAVFDHGRSHTQAFALVQQLSTLAALAALFLAQTSTANPQAKGQAAASNPAGGAAAKDGEKKAEPWRLTKEAALPSWLKLSGMQRTRFESLDGQFRAANTLDDSDHQWAVRTTLRADVALERFIASAEMWDARQFESDRGSVVDTTVVNSAEMVQLFAGYEDKDVFAAGDKASVIFGRHTMDLGNRRLVARNDFRNTTNTFLGFNARWESKSKNVLQAFFTLPTRRLPSDFDSLLDNDVELDDENRHVKFWGVYGTLAELFDKANLELYYLGIDEQDAPGLATANRAFSTVGARVVKRPAKELLDYEVEATYQFGDSRSSTTSNTDLDHKAEHVHLEAGYTFDHDWKPRGVLQFDYASGDDSPTDGENNRFDTLFGARRWEFGPTGIFGAIARSNVLTPGLRVFVQPRSDIEVMAAYRPFYLASDTDTYVPGGVRDQSGGSGEHVGDLSEVRVRWHVAPGNWMLEFGVAYLAAGEFLDDAPNASGNGDTSYVYVQSLFTF
jgi:hypothetical protein